MVFLQTGLAIVWRRATRSLWCATLFRDIHTAVDAGNVHLRENFMVELKKIFVRQRSEGCGYTLGGGEIVNFRAQEIIYF
jgi:hypothetical protein